MWCCKGKHEKKRSLVKKKERESFFLLCERFPAFKTGLFSVVRHAVPQLPVVCSSAAPYFSHHPPIPASFEPSGTTPAQGYDRNTQESNQRLRNIFATLHYSVLQCQGSSHRSALGPTTIRRLVRGERADCVIFNCKACWRGETKKKKKPC